MQTFCRVWTRAIFLVGVVASVLGAQAKRSSDFLYVWTASADTTQPDFLAVFDVRPTSDSYGRLMTTVPVPGRINVPHHTEHEMPADAQLFANGFRSGQTFIFDMSEPAHPRLELYDPHGQIGDVWPTALAIPGFIGGVVFSALLWIAEGRHSFDKVSLARFATWGVVTGLMLGVLTIPAKVGDVSPGALGMIGIATALSAVAAIGSAVFSRLFVKGRLAKLLNRIHVRINRPDSVRSVVQLYPGP